MKKTPVQQMADDGERGDGGQRKHGFRAQRIEERFCADSVMNGFRINVRLNRERQRSRQHEAREWKTRQSRSIVDEAVRTRRREANGKQHHETRMPHQEAMQPSVAEAFNPRAADEARDRVADAAAEGASGSCNKGGPMRRKKQRRDEEENRSGQGEGPSRGHRADYQDRSPDINSQFR